MNPVSELVALLENLQDLIRNPNLVHYISALISEEVSHRTWMTFVSRKQRAALCLLLKFSCLGTDA